MSCAKLGVGKGIHCRQTNKSIISNTTS